MVCNASVVPHAKGGCGVVHTTHAQCSLEVNSCVQALVKCRVVVKPCVSRSLVSPYMI
jgi:hypothetical protein